MTAGAIRDRRRLVDAAGGWLRVVLEVVGRLRVVGLLVPRVVTR